LGFYRYASPEHVNKLKVGAITNNDLFGVASYPPMRNRVRGLPETADTLSHPATKRNHHVDAERLAEGGVLRFISQIEPFLLDQLRLKELETGEETNTQGWIVTLCDEEQLIYSEEESSMDDLWERATARTFELVNRVLKSAGSQERAYALYGGNDLEAVFLTHEMFGVIKDSKLPLKLKPYETVNQKPWANLLE
jgi:hypothetical protein